MIQTIIKRDGTEQDFEPDKINGWGIWASEELGDLVSWPSVVLTAVSTLPTACPSELLQKQLIRVCLDYNTYSYHLMAGKLYSALMRKDIFEYGLPSLLTLHNRLATKGRMEKLSFSIAEYVELNDYIDHSRDETYAYGSLKQIRVKYALKNKAKGEEHETPQFVFMRMAMSLADSVEDAKALYDHFSLGRINCPTPNYVNLGTPLRGLSSCCVYAVGDSAKSLAIGDHIAYTMTYMSAGIGSHLKTRSLGDPVRNGAIDHQGKLPYYRSLAGAVTAQMQAGRGGACTTYFNLYDPEAPTLIRLKNPKSVETKRIRLLDYSFGVNRFFAAKAAKDEEVFTFNVYTAPKLYEALYSKDDTEQDFIDEYNRLLEDPSFEKNFISARGLLLEALNEYSETGRLYPHFLTEMNAHTPFLDSIYSSNLCTEIFLPTSPYSTMQSLYSTEDRGSGEVAMCNLAGLCPSNIHSEEEYASAAYYALYMIDKCIHRTHYELPHVGVTTTARMNAGVGIVGLAHYIAKAGLKYSSIEGKQFIHDTAERHYWHLLNASLRLGKELGNAYWMHKTKWPQGYLPTDTSNVAVESILPNSRPNYDWEGLRAAIIENKGIRNSVLVAHMPTESSSKAVGLPNGVYPIRELALSKTDNDSVIEWVAKESDTLAEAYESAWDISAKDYTEVYAILQKWTDQGISADYYQTLVGEDTISSSEVLQDFFYQIKLGLKSRYYLNSKTSEGIELEIEETECDSGGCKL